MSHEGSASTPHLVRGLEVALAVCLGAALLAVALPFPGLAAIYLPQLAMLALLAGTLALVDRRLPATNSRGLAAAAAAVTIGVVGLAYWELAMVAPVGIDFARYVLLLPYAFGAGLVAGAWAARPGTHFPRLLLHAFVASTVPIVLYAGIALLMRALGRGDSTTTVRAAVDLLLAVVRS